MRCLTVADLNCTVQDAGLAGNPERPSLTSSIVPSRDETTFECSSVDHSPQSASFFGISLPFCGRPDSTLGVLA